MHHRGMPELRTEPIHGIVDAAVFVAKPRVAVATNNHPTVEEEEDEAEDADATNNADAGDDVDATDDLNQTSVTSSSSEMSRV